MYDPDGEFYKDFERQRGIFRDKFHGNPTKGKVTLYLLKSCFKYFIIWLLGVLCLLGIILYQLGVIWCQNQMMILLKKDFVVYLSL